MIEHSSKSKGYLPMKSGPNMMGFDMGKSGSLMEMMQVGGQPSRGAAMLARSRQRQSDIKKLEEVQRAEAKRQKRGGLFGSIGGLAGGLLGAALAPVTGGASLALAAGLGTALGRRAGEGLGAGKSRSVDRTGTVFGQQSFRDVEQASRDYTRGMGERALISGLKAAAMAGLSPSGGIYGATGRAAEAGKLGTSGTRLREGASAIGKTGSKLGLGSGKALTTASGELLSSGLPADIAGSGLADTVLKGLDRPGGNTFGISQIPSLNEAEILGDVAVPDFDVSLPDFSDLPQAPSVSEMAYRRSLPNAVSLGEQNALLDAARTAQTARSQAMQTSDEMQRLIDYLSGGEQVSFVPFGRNAGLPFGSFEDGGLIEYQYGGGVSGIQSILQDAGITASPEQLALFEQFDPSSLNELASGLQSSLLSGTKEIQTQQAGTGFAGSGVVQQAKKEQRESAMGQLASAQEKAARGFESQTLGDAASLINQGAEFGTYTAPPPTVSTLPTSDQGAVTFNNIEYVWDSETGQYVTRDVYEQGLADQQSGQD